MVFMNVGNYNIYHTPMDPMGPEKFQTFPAFEFRSSRCSYHSSYPSPYLGGFRVTEVQVENHLATWVVSKKNWWVSPTTMGFSLLKRIILGCEMGVPPF